MFKKKTVDIIIAIACAFALWAYVTTNVSPPEDRVVRGVNVDLVNLEALQADNLTVGSGSFAIDVTIRGPRAEVAKLTAEDFKATADMSNYPLGTNLVGVKVTGPESVEITEIHPDRIEVEVEELVSANKPIKLNYSETFPPDMDPGFISATPDPIEVSGTKSEVDRVSYVRAEIDSSQLRESERTINATVTPVDKSGDRVYVTMSQESVEVTLRLCYVKEVPLNIEIRGKPPGSLAVTKQDIPDKVFIRGGEDALAKITSVMATPIDIGNLRATTIITPELHLPEGEVELADASKDIAVTIEIGGEEAKSFSVTNDMIEIRGVPEGYSANIVTAQITATVFGSHEQIESFSPNDLEIFVDLSNRDFSQGKVQPFLSYEETDTLKRIDFSPIAVDVRVTAFPELGSSSSNAPEAENLSGASVEAGGETAS
ncbi:MAG: hypothetical protein LBS67_05185 [Clostridiales Family XIII bacterium]|jgi:YbbR domain-containing protein|nr:hypothetical protein [Clostridiales Family XIII bacterium]